MNDEPTASIMFRSEDPIQAETMRTVREVIWAKILQSWGPIYKGRSQSHV